MKVKAFILIVVILLAAGAALGCSAHNPYYNTYDYSGKGGPGAIDMSGYAKEYEALEWLEENPNEHAFAGNRFENSQAAKEFVQNLYDLGATKVLITGIYDEEWRIKEEGGPYADALIVTLSADWEKRKAIIEIYRKEYEAEYGGEMGGADGDTLYFWWD